MKFEQIEIIKREMQQKGLSQRNLANLLEVSDNTVSKWLKGLTKPSDEYVLKLAEIFDKPVAYIRGEANNLVPLLSEVQAGLWTETMEERFDCDWIEVPGVVKAKCFAVKINGDSMMRNTSPSIADGSYCLVDPTCDKSPDLLNHKVVIAKLPDGYCTIKEFVYELSSAYLKPWNTTYSIMPIDSNVQIIGRVLKTWQDL